ncbi:HAMP domain-containing protein [Piscinibacter sakaiensis]|uniref:HAMP domain-containing protein n=1 Tax=Piscinibacter sakaiensis TaxID=1547922 RepID=UPI00372CD04C
MLDEVRAGTPRQPWLIDADGVVLHHPDPQWRFRSLVPLAPAVLERIRADQRFRRDRIESLGLPALAEAVAGARAWLLARGLTRPVLALTRAAEALKRGDYAGATLTVRRHDELGRLARTFNVMIDVLRQREREGRAPAAEGGR